MRRAGPARLPLPFAILVAVALFVEPRAGAALPITSRILIDPAGEHTGDVFGCSVAWVGDVNGDGYDDLLVGAFRYPEIASVGQAYLFFGGPAIDSVADLVIPAPAGGSGWFGVSVASAGDFNGDGSPDFIIGAQQAGYEGKAFIYYGGPSLDATPDFTLTGESTGALTAFGASVASAGDMNEDGFDDVIVGAPWYGGGGNKPGRAYVFFGGAAPDAVPDRVFSGAGFYDQLGTVVGSAGDLNGDGHPDLFASAPNSDVGVLNAGAIYVWFGGPVFDTTPDLTLLGSGVNEHFGGSGVDTLEDLYYVGNDPRAGIGLGIAGGGHVDGPGPSDLIASAYWDPEAIGYNMGRVYVFATSGLPIDTCPGQADGTACDDGNSCTGGEVCGGGVCGGGRPVLPPVVNGTVGLVGDKSGATISWSDPLGPYSVYRGTRSGGSPWAYNQTCHTSHTPASSATDLENPSTGTMFYYLVTRIEACGESIPGEDSGGQPNPNPSPCP
jgi:hypothetical protein